jgi:hypothetical protein
MNDNEPRPMPPEVLRAYRDPLNLRKLLSSAVFTDAQRMSVCDELVARLVRKHGNADVLVGQDHASARSMSFSDRSKQLESAVGVVEFAMSFDEYGGEESVLVELAQVMQPYWTRWWTSFEWKKVQDAGGFARPTSCVLSERQLAWISAQCARSVIGQARPEHLQACLLVISAVEKWAIDPSDKNIKAAVAYGDEVGRLVAESGYMGSGPVFAGITNMAIASVNAASAARSAAEVVASKPDEDGFSYAAVRMANVMLVCSLSGPGRSDLAGATEAIIAARSSAMSDNRARLLAVVRRLITPTLITSASRGLR